jgi:predicted Zn-dependent protease
MRKLARIDVLPAGRLTSEVTAMFILRSNLRVGVLIAGLFMAVPVLARGDGQQSSGQDDQSGTMAEYQKMLQANPKSSLANYRVAELLLNQRNYQASANCFRFALHGDRDPSWTVVWSHLQLGKIFDLTNQRMRAEKEYRLAVLTNDNTLGAITEAEHLLQEPYKWPEAH